MGIFTEGVNDDDRRGFTYTDTDGDKLKVWRWRGGSFSANIRFDVVSQGGGVDLDASDFDEFDRQIAELRKTPCPTCSGKGTL